MNEVIEFLSENPVVYLATLGLDGNAKVRPIMYYFEENGNPYFCTANTKPMYKELDANNNFELTAANSEFKWLRISGEVEFVDDLRLKEKVLELNDLVKGLYETADNPVFELFTLKNAHAVIADFSGEPAKEFDL